MKASWNMKVSDYWSPWNNPKESGKNTRGTGNSREN